MLNYILQNSDFATLAKLLSPSLFRTIPPKVALSFITSVYKNQSQLKTWNEIISALSMDFSIFNPDLKVSLTDFNTSLNDTKNLKKNKIVINSELAHHILELYFFQIQTRSRLALDFRKSAFSLSNSSDNLGEGNHLHWQPKPLFYEAAPEFTQGISQLYYGHYLKDEVKFRQGLEILGLGQTREIIRRHFGSGDLTSYQFDLKAFQGTFSELIHSCSENGIQIHSDFLALGAMLMGLYETLENTGQINVQLCYENAFKFSQTFCQSSNPAQAP